MTRRTLLVGIAAATAMLGSVPASPASPAAPTRTAAPAAQVAEVAEVAEVAPAGAGQAPNGGRGGGLFGLDAAFIGELVGVVRPRAAGHWVTPTADGDELHIGVVGATDADRQAVADAAAASAAGRDVRVVVDDARHSALTLDAARQAVARELAARRVGDFTVEVEPQANRVLARVETAGPLADVVAAWARQSARAATVEAVAADALAAAGDPAGARPPEVAVVPQSEVEVEPLNATPDSFPPYEAGLWVDVTSPDLVFHCTTAYTFAVSGTTYGSTAGHCGDVGTRVTGGAAGRAPIGSVTANGFYSTKAVESDVALYDLPAGTPVSRAVHGGPHGHRTIIGALADRDITRGTQLCFAGRASGADQCGPVNAVARDTCCDASDRSFVFTCTDRAALSGDSGGPVYQPVGSTEARAVGLLSSSVTIDGTSSMCFTTVDAARRALGASLSVPAA